MVDTLASITKLLGHPVDEFALDRPLEELTPNRIPKTLLIGILLRAGGPELEHYLTPRLTLREAIHWVETLRAQTQPQPSAVVRLRPLDESDISPLYRAAMDSSSSYRWRFRGATLGWDAFVQTLWAGTFAQFMVEGIEDRERFGLVAAYNAQPDLGHAYVAMYRCSPRRGRGEVATGAAMLLSHLFTSFPFRKLYAELPAFNEDDLGLGSLGVFHHEARFVDHDYHAGRWWDRDVYSVWKDEWWDFDSTVLGSSVPNQDGPLTPGVI